MGNQEVEMKGYEIVEDSGKEQWLEANCIKETDVASWLPQLNGSSTVCD